MIYNGLCGFRFASGFACLQIHPEATRKGNFFRAPHQRLLDDRGRPQKAPPSLYRYEPATYGWRRYFDQDASRWLTAVGLPLTTQAKIQMLTSGETTRHSSAG